jgi:hypothetical protein
MFRIGKMYTDSRFLRLLYKNLVVLDGCFSWHLVCDKKRETLVWKRETRGSLPKLN